MIYMQHCGLGVNVCVLTRRIGSDAHYKIQDQNISAFARTMWSAKSMCMASIS